MKVLITGATGFVGQAITKKLEKDAAYVVVVAVRSHLQNFSAAVSRVVAGDLTAKTDWSTALQGVEVVVHCAARVHVMEDKASDPITEYRKINVDGTMKLINDAHRAGCKRFIFLSSIKVNGEKTTDQAYSADEVPHPEDAYGISKYEAENKLLEFSKNNDIEVVIIRPPLVYGPGVKANFQKMMKWLNKGIPLPFGLIKNKRSMVALDNLVDLIVVCLKHPKARNEVFLVSDDKALSTKDLLVLLGSALGKSVFLIPIPMTLLKLLFSLIGKRSMIDRLNDSLVVDIQKTKNFLNWKPPYSVESQLNVTAQAYLNGEKK